MERDIEKYARKLVTKQGGLLLKLAYTLNGLPDRLMLLPNGRAAFIEFKSNDGRPTALQLHWQGRLKALGFEALIAHSKEEAKEAVIGASSSRVPGILQK